MGVFSLGTQVSSIDYHLQALFNKQKTHAISALSNEQSVVHLFKMICSTVNGL